jgi:hypothetical protein
MSESLFKRCDESEVVPNFIAAKTELASQHSHLHEALLQGVLSRTVKDHSLDLVTC